MSIYERYGIKTLINAAGEKTLLGGSRMDPEVLQAMEEASHSFSTIEEVEAKASEIIAKITGAEAGYVVSGAAAGLTLSAAACMVGLDIKKINQLPDTTGMKNEVIIPRTHRNSYDHAIRATGAKLVEVGFDDRAAGSGVRVQEPWEIEAGISEQTAAVHAVATSHNHDFLKDLVKITRKYNIPIILDAAAQLPPKNNLRKFIQMGIDIAVFSGGKAIKGPQGTGIICGKKEYIKSIALQHLDLDVPFHLWNPPETLISKKELNGLPRHGIGRGFKLGKEEIIGLLVALERFVQKDEKAEQKKFSSICEDIGGALEKIDGLSVNYLSPSITKKIHLTEVTVDSKVLGMNATELIKKLRTGTPRVFVRTERADKGKIVINPACLHNDEVDIVIKKFQQIINK